jgi:acetylornithine deacetylase/succinyl-diaminopimelate desuccinylase-like protein
MCKYVLGVIMSLELQKIYDYIDEHIEEHVTSIQEFVRQKSISHTGEGIKECAELVEKYFKELGCQETRIEEPGVAKWGMEGDPVVVGKYDAGAEKTVLFYIMYDTMPVYHGELELWSVPPWEARIVEMPPFPRVIMGRGATNTKGPAMSFIKSCEAIKEVSGELPVNLYFIAEGDEERMDIGLNKFMNDNADEFRDADALFWSGGQRRNGLASIGGGSEGCLYFELTTSGEYWGRGPTKYSVHGGNKRWLDSPAWRHIEMLSTLITDNGNKIMVDGWYDNMEPPSPEDTDLLREIASKTDIEADKEALGAKVFMNDLTDPFELLKMRGYGTSINLDGIWGGRILDTGAGACLPYKITSKHNCRYVPNQNGEDLSNKIRKHLDNHGYSDVQMRIVGDVDWCKFKRDTEIVKAIVKTYEKFGVDYVSASPPTISGSDAGPYWPAYLFGKNPLNLPIARGGLGHGGRAHAIDEYYVIEGAGKVYGLAGAEKANASVLYYYAGKA